MKEVTTNLKQTNLKRVLAWCLAICMCLTVVQVNDVLANNTTDVYSATATDANATEANATAANCKIVLAKKSYTYKNGKAIKPAVKVKNSKGKVVSKKNYKVTYKNNKKIGTATVVVKFNKNSSYKGTIKATFKIVPASTKLSSVKAGKKAFTVKWAKKTKNTSGYQIRYSTSKKFTAKKTKVVTVKSNKSTSKTIKKLKANKKYYVQVRTYKVVKGKKYVSSWSKVKSVKTK